MIFKIKKVTPPYTQVHNNIIDNPGLSGKAKWILIYLLSKPENWQVFEKDITTHCTDGKDSIRSGIHELMIAGYIKRGKRQRNNLGQLKGYEYEVYEIPNNQTTSYKDGFPYVGKPAHSNINYNKDENGFIEPDWELIQNKKEAIQEAFRKVDEQMIQKDIDALRYKPSQVM
jgi:hypothetical protein